VALADTIAPYVDLMYSADHPSWAMLATGALGFTVQALADFSGYTDIARGTARMLGIELMDNFDHPYMAATPMEFWQRWHMSFSTWLRDYIYVPACFSDWVRRWLTIPGTGDWGPFASTSRALLITMVVSGLWHGSSWNFVVWGLYYAVIGTIYAWIVTKIPRKMKKDARWRWVTVPVMFGFTVFGMNIFRESSLPRLWAGLHTLPWEGTTSQWVVSTAMLGLVAYASLPLVVALIVEKTLMPRLRDVPFYPAIRATWWAVQVVAVFASVRTTAADFIYFQF
jgi:D-alanyl-lipoteichoic acid acyltransferase DltB (MBOAT superfamily)